MSDLTDNWFYLSTDRIWLCLRLNITSLSGPAIDLQKMPFSAKKKVVFSDETHFDFGGYKNKQNCCIWGTENPHAYIDKPTHPKRASVVRILFQRHNWAMSKERPLQSMAIIIGSCWTYFSSQKLKRRIVATFGFNRTALRATQPKLHTMFYAMFLKTALSAAELMSFGHLGAAIWHRWTIICGVPSKISVTPTSQKQLML